MPIHLIPTIKRAASLLGVVLALFQLASGQDAPPYRDAKRPVEQRVADLLSRMTLEEKVAQLEGVWENRQFPLDPKTLFVDEKNAFLPDRAALVLKNGLGEMSRPSEQRGPRAILHRAEDGSRCRARG